MNLRMKMLCIAALGAGSTALGATAAAASPDRQIEERCDVQARAGHVLQTVAMRDLHVLALTAADRFEPALPSGAEAIVCLRSSITPAAHDDKVLALGIPLIIVELGRPHRLGVLEVSDGAFRFRMMEGSLPAADQAAVQARLEEYRSRISGTAG
jgi:hypothetical protein